MAYGDQLNELDIKRETKCQMLSTNTPASSEANIILDLIEIIEQKTKITNTGSIIICNNNRKLHQMIISECPKEAQCTDECRAEVARIKQIV